MMVCVENGTVSVRVSSPWVTRRTRRMVCEPSFSTLTRSSLFRTMPLESRDRRGRQLAIGGLRTLAVGDDGHRAVLVDDQTAGELAIDIVDVHGDPGCFVLIGLENPSSWSALVGHRPERHLLAVDGDGGLIGRCAR